MAIKKGAFDLYVQERTLPEKNNKSQPKTSHFFDDVYNDKNGSQSVHKQFTKREDNLFSLPVEQKSSLVISEINNNECNFSSLVGIQRKIIIALYKNMKVNKSDTTEELTLETIANLAGVNHKSLKNTLFRLIKAGFLSRVEQKNGRGGWVKYKVNEKVVDEIKHKR